jgi:hypothetical protein
MKLPLSDISDTVLFSFITFKLISILQFNFLHKLKTCIAVIKKIYFQKLFPHTSSLNRKMQNLEYLLKMIGNDVAEQIFLEIKLFEICTVIVLLVFSYELVQNLVNVAQMI